MLSKKIAPSDFVGRGKIVNTDKTIPVIIHGTYNPYEPGPTFCTVAPDGRRKSLGDLSNPEEIEIRATTNDGKDITILGLDQITITHLGSQTICQGTAKYFIKGQLKTFAAQGNEIHCSLFIPYTPLAKADAHYTRSYDGTITLSERSNRNGIKWNTPLGLAELIDHYDYVEDKVGIDAATIRIRRCQAHLVIKPKGRYSLEKLIRGLPDAFDETFWFISFLSRKRIVWHSVEVNAFPSEGSSEFREAVAHRQSWLGFLEEQRYEQTSIDILLKINELRNGLFEKLHENFMASPYKTLIRRTIPFLIMSYEQGYFESHIANTYSALETMVAGLSSDADQDVGLLLSTGDFRHLTKKLKDVIRAEIDDGDIQDGISSKLGELNRRPILDRLTTLLERYQVPMAQLWPPDSNIKEQLHQIIKRRNLYIHQGRIDDFHQYYRDYTRLRILVELWILKLLECPDEAINSVAIKIFVK